ncbi:Fucolectin-4 Precursor [Triplophysa tibetana]|uniref:Fucolectin-4 n=1 Tax=Triplophysa tibetana TaxID=1572043 RepID=A0A5A9PMG0_9TELE|nr:Fucolectin-4 Precursor [Triplophysa tibetana]
MDIVAISLLALWLYLCVGHSTENLARSAYAVQSSTYDELSEAQHAVDGNRDSNFMHGSCTHTEKENDPWLRVDLKHIYSVNKIIITNRGDNCAERIEGAQIRIGNSLDNNGNDNQLAATILTAPEDTETYTFKPINGRYINIFLPGMEKYLTVCELEVYTENLARSAYAVQSSTYYELSEAQHAVDGNRDSNFMHGSCTHTEKENDPWLRVDLKHIYSVNKIIITNRGDNCAERIEGAQIRIGNSLDNNGNNNQLAATILTAPEDTETYTFKPINGRYINIFLPGMEKYLTVCELEVYTDEPREEMMNYTKQQ